MNSARRYLNLAFLSKDVSDVTVCPTAAAEFTDEFAVRLQTGAGRFVGQAVEDLPEFGVHGQGASLPSLYLKAMNNHLMVSF